MNKKYLALGGAALIAVGAMGGFIAAPEKIITETKEINNTVEVPGPVQVKYETVTVKEIQYVDNGKLEAVLEYIYENDGNLSRLAEDLDDDEYHLIGSRIVMENDFIALAENAARSRAFSELHKDNSTGIKLDREDLSFRKEAIDEDFTAIEWIDDKFEAILRVIFEAGAVEDVELESVTKL
jgi:hypothetical protein